MRSRMQTFRDIIGFWPSLDAMATDAKTTVGAIKQWRNRNSIPGEYWLALEVGAAQRNIPGVTMHTLGAIANRRRPAEAAA